MLFDQLGWLRLPWILGWKRRKERRLRVRWTIVGIGKQHILLFPLISPHLGNSSCILLFLFTASHASLFIASPCMACKNCVFHWSWMKGGQFRSVPFFLFWIDMETLEHLDKGTMGHPGNKTTRRWDNRTTGQWDNRTTKLQDYMSTGPGLHEKGDMIMMMKVTNNITEIIIFIITINLILIL